VVRHGVEQGPALTPGTYLTACKLCGQPRIRPKYELRRLGLTVFECGDCGLKFIGDDLGHDRVQAIYNREELAGYFRATAGRHRRKFEPRLPELAHLGARRGARVLDVGCGSGEFVALAMAAGYEAVGVDISVPSIEVAREFHPTGDFRVGTVEELAEAEAGTFDVVTQWDVIEHALDPHAVVAASAGALAPGGLLALGTPNGDSAYDSLIALAYPTRTPLADRMMEQRYSDWHLQIWAVSTLSRLVRDHGLEVVSARRHKELSASPSLYVAQSGYPRAGSIAKMLDPVVEALWPIRNKLTLYARKPAGATT
jgi:2-polyprenyl-3-methyl-5-hydroxy-6-metoxy-1,4-benzoquinol methylase